MKYIEGLYCYWDMIANNYPESFREQCSGGGRRIDLETVIRMHSHQDSDYWFRWETDQNQIWGMSQYLPNSAFVSHLHNYRPETGYTVDGFDDYAFCSNMAASLCLGWFADDPEFDKVTAKEYIDRYLAYRELFVGAWYPFLESSMESDCWMGAQYHRPDMRQGIIIVQRRENSPYAAFDAKFHGLQAGAKYRITEEKTQKSQLLTGAELMKGFRITIENRPGSAVYLYSEVTP
jgi:alpha-galactosidase